MIPANAQAFSGKGVDPPVDGACLVGPDRNAREVRKPNVACDEPMTGFRARFA